MLLALSLVAVAWAGTASKPSADEAWKQAEAVSSAGPGDLKGKSREEVARLTAAREERIHQAYLGFYENYPDDVRRWDAVLMLLRQSPRVVGTDKQRELQAAMAAALPGLPARLRERFEARPLFNDIGALYSKLEHSEKVDWAPLRARVDAHLAKYPEEEAIAGVVSRYMGMYERDHTAAETLAEWRALTVNPVVRRSELIAGRLAVIVRELGKPMEMSFAAADGREVDLQKLRGKVVFIDFWATWCVPCVAELPNVKRVYDAYHDKGFEVIGIALENAGLKPEDTPAQAAAKHAAARGKLLDFARERGLPWPQYYDGKYWDNDIALGRFNVHSVPSTFLLDKRGVVAVVNVRGPQLESEVKRLLE